MNPEIVIERILLRGLNFLQSNAEILGYLLRNFDTDNIEKAKEWVRRGLVAMVQGYPLQNDPLPCIAIVMQGENETASVLGDHTGDNIVLDYPSASAPDLPPIRQNDGVTYDPNGEEVQLLGGTRVVAGSTIENENLKEVGEVQRLYSDLDRISRRGIGEQANFQLMLFTTNRYQTIVLYNIVRFILLFYRVPLERNGIINLRLGGADMQPVQEYFPQPAYGRAMTLDFTYFTKLYDVDPRVDAFIWELEAATLSVQPDGDLKLNTDTILVYGGKLPEED